MMELIASGKSSGVAVSVPPPTAAAAAAATAAASPSSTVCVLGSDAKHQHHHHHHDPKPTNQWQHLNCQTLTSIWQLPQLFQLAAPSHWNFKYSTICIIMYCDIVVP